jgi:CHRD domain
MYRSVLAGATIMAAAALATISSNANAQTFHADLSGFQELGALNAETGAIFSPGTGTLDLKLDQKLQMLTYTLTYSGLTSPVLQAHIHFGQIHVPGGIFLFLCTNLGNGPVGTPACPTSGTVTGQLTPASVVAVPGQNITAGDFSIVPAALLSDSAYVNVHTNNFKAGEIRGQILQPENEDQQGQNQNQN